VEAARYLRLKEVSASTCTEIEQDNKKDTIPQAITVINASTGGYAALLSLIPAMTRCPETPVVVSLGTPSKHLTAFVDYLQNYVPFPVRRAQDGETLIKGAFYFLSKEEAASLESRSDSLVLHTGPHQDLSEDEGSVDLLLYSASALFKTATLAIFLSGDDTAGLSGAKEVHRMGGTVIVQRDETCLAPEISRRIAQGTETLPRSLTELATLIPAWNG
jgi:two-component system chemotaxis response regulator CheB